MLHRNVDMKSPDTFVRTIYAGNAVATVKSEEPVKVIRGLILNVLRSLLTYNCN